MTEADWTQVWPFFDDVVQAGETYSYPADLSATMGPNRPARGGARG
jgi:hypothetical protein